MGDCLALLEEMQYITVYMLFKRIYPAAAVEMIQVKERAIVESRATCKR